MGFHLLGTDIGCGGGGFNGPKVNGSLTRWPLIRGTLAD
jgi:hypothetical protein